MESTDILELFSADIDGETRQGSKDGVQGISSSGIRCDERNGAELGCPNGNSEIVASRHNDNDFSFYHDNLPVHLMLNKDSSQSLSLCHVKGSLVSIKEKVTEEVSDRGKYAVLARGLSLASDDELLREAMEVSNLLLGGRSISPEKPNSTLNHIQHNREKEWKVESYGCLVSRGVAHRRINQSFFSHPPAAAAETEGQHGRSNHHSGDFGGEALGTRELVGNFSESRGTHLSYLGYSDFADFGEEVCAPPENTRAALAEKSWERKAINNTANTKVISRRVDSESSAKVEATHHPGAFKTNRHMQPLVIERFSGSSESEDNKDDTLPSKAAGAALQQISEETDEMRILSHYLETLFGSHFT